MQSGIEHYFQRLKHYVEIKIIELPDVSNGKGDEATKRESAELKKHIHPNDHLWLLDEHGDEFNSREFAALLQKKMNAGTRELKLAIGGAYGFHHTIGELSERKISFSRMTFPHDLIRLVLAEQLYRAHTIIKGEKYHHD